MGELGKWGKANNKYITIGDGETFEGVFEGARITQSTFNPEQETIQYKLDGKLFNSASRRLADDMDNVPIGKKVRITRTGTQRKTKYKVEWDEEDGS